MISAEQAVQALKEASVTERRSAEAYSYSQSAPYCFVWGVVWLLGYGAEGLLPIDHPAWMWMGWWWMAISMIGAAVSVAIGARQNARRPGRSWRMGALFGIIWLFSFFLFTLWHPKPAEIGAYFPLLFAAIYTAVGLWMGLRFILVGAFVGAMTLVAYFYLREYFFQLMALVGGGSLLLTGFWMRKA